MRLSCWPRAYKHIGLFVTSKDKAKCLRIQSLNDCWVRCDAATFQYDQSSLGTREGDQGSSGAADFLEDVMIIQELHVLLLLRLPPCSPHTPVHRIHNSPQTNQHPCPTILEYITQPQGHKQLVTLFIKHTRSRSLCLCILVNSSSTTHTGSQCPHRMFVGWLLHATTDHCQDKPTWNRLSLSPHMLTQCKALHMPQQRELVQGSLGCSSQYTLCAD